jgi:hypothetical protein
MFIGIFQDQVPTSSHIAHPSLGIGFQESVSHLTILVDIDIDIENYRETQTFGTIAWTVICHPVGYSFVICL